MPLSPTHNTTPPNSNLVPAELYEKALMHEPGTCIVSSGAIAALSGW